MSCVAVECVNADGGRCSTATSCCPILNGLRCPRLGQDTLQFFNPAREIAVTWSIEDVQHERGDLTDEQAYKVLSKVWDDHDANYGVNWSTLKDAADSLFQKRTGEDDEGEI